MFPRYGFQIFLQTCVTIPVVPAVSGMIKNFVFHIRCISVHRLRYFSFFSCFLRDIFRWQCHIITGFNYYICPVCRIFPVSVYRLTMSRLHGHVLCVCACDLSFRCVVYFIFSNVNTQQLCHLSFLAKTGHPKVR